MSKTTQKSGKTKSILIVISCALAVVIIAGVLFLDAFKASGYTYRKQIAVKSENYTVSTAMMNYFFNSNYMQLSSYLGIDTSKPLDQQKYTETETMFDYFMDYTFSQVHQMLVLCEAAKDAGFKADDAGHDGHEHGTIDDTIKMYKSYAKQGGFKSVDDYFQAMFGNGVTEDVVRKCMEMSDLASHYSEHMSDSYEFTEEQWAEYFDEKPDSFRKVDYLSFTFEGTVEEAAKDATEDEKNAVKEKNEAQAAVLEKYAEELAATADADAFEAYVENYLTTVKYKVKEDEKKDDEADKADKAEDKAEADAEKAADADDAAADEKADAEEKVVYVDDKGKEVDIQALLDKCLTEGATKNAENDLNKFLFAEKNEKITYTVKNKDKLQYTVYMLLPAQNDSIGHAHMYRDNYMLQNYYYIPFLAESYNKSEADANKAAAKAYEELKEKATEENMESLVEANAGYHSENGGYLNIDEVDEWIFSADRKANDHAVITVEGKGSYIVYYAGVGEYEKWEYDVDNALMNEKYNEEYEKLEKTHKIKKSQAGLDLVKAISLAG